MSIILLSAPSGTGKTSTCQELLTLSRQSDLRVTGVLSLPVTHDGQKVAIRLCDLNTGQENLLARRITSDKIADVGTWEFEENTIAWGQDICANLPRSDLLILDEIGPLELEQKRGLTHIVDALFHAEYRLAVVTIRPVLIKRIMDCLEDLPVSVLSLTTWTRQTVLRKIMASLQELL